MQVAIDVVFVVRYVFLNELMGSIHRPHQGDLFQRRTVKNDEDHVKKSEERGDAEKEFERVHFGRNVWLVVSTKIPAPLVVMWVLENWKSAFRFCREVEEDVLKSEKKLERERDEEIMKS